MHKCRPPSRPRKCKRQKSLRCTGRHAHRCRLRMVCNLHRSVLQHKRCRWFHSSCSGIHHNRHLRQLCRDGGRTKSNPCTWGQKCFPHKCRKRYPSNQLCNYTHHLGQVCTCHERNLHSSCSWPQSVQRHTHCIVYRSSQLSICIYR